MNWIFKSYTCFCIPAMILKCNCFFLLCVRFTTSVLLPHNGYWHCRCLEITSCSPLSWLSVKRLTWTHNKGAWGRGDTPALRPQNYICVASSQCFVSGRPGYISQLRNQLSCLRLTVVLLSPSNQTPGYSFYYAVTAPIHVFFNFSSCHLAQYSLSSWHRR
jgi:hypothetical protein